MRRATIAAVLAIAESFEHTRPGGPCRMFVLVGAIGLEPVAPYPSSISLSASFSGERNDVVCPGGVNTASRSMAIL